MRNAVVRIRSSELEARLGCQVVLACECFQTTGSFKFRAALHVVQQVDRPLFIAASSGNFGQALAFACRLHQRQSIIVMPHDSARIKVEAVRSFGGRVELIDVQRISRAEKVRQLMEQHPEAYQASAYDDPLVIEGNASLGRELAAFPDPLQAVLAPIGGGGLTAGLFQGLHQARRPLPLWAVEPLLANDAAQSLRQGRLVALEHEPKTMADGVRSTRLGHHNWNILKDGLAGVLEVPESAIAEALRLLFETTNLKTEPTGALSIAALLSHPHAFRDQTVCCVISGGNVDTDLFCRILRQEQEP